jgi:hypothetical protein
MGGVQQCAPPGPREQLLSIAEQRRELNSKAQNLKKK